MEHAAPSRQLRVLHVMGTVITVDVRAPFVPAGVLDVVEAWFADVDRRFSTFRQDSEISRLDRGELELADASAAVRRVLQMAALLQRDSGGRFDVRARGCLDPSALVKGWSVDEAMARLCAGGARNAAINAGGDVLVRGEAAPGETWRIGIRHPTRPDALAAVVSGRDLGVATSGAYERDAHIVDPSTGQPPHGVDSVTVIGPELGLCDAYATAAFAGGMDGVRWASTLEGHGVIAVTVKGRMVCNDLALQLRADGESGRRADNARISADSVGIS
jgi:thiamine biosynthesis lipoprotein